MAIYRLNRVLEDGDAAVMERVRAGDTESFEVLVERHSHAVFRLVCRMTDNEQDADDVVQETFLRALDRLRRVTFRTGVPSRLGGVGTNCCMDRQRTPQEREYDY